MNTPIEKYVSALAPARLDYALKEIKARLDFFLELLEQAKPGLSQLGVEATLSDGLGHLKNAVFTTPLGVIDMKGVYLWDQDYVGVGLTFTDTVTVVDRRHTRKLQSLRLGDEGNWIDADGNKLGDQWRQLAPATVTALVQKAMAAKLKADTEEFLTYSRTAS